MITVVKLSPLGEEKIQYPAKLSARLENGVVLDARWNYARKDLGYTIFEPGDHFTEYFYTDRWFNIFAISDTQGRRKGWYCNVAEPANIAEQQVRQVDLFLDVWVAPTGQALVLDEDEFAADLTMSGMQRQGAQQGLHALLVLIAARQEPFAELR